MTPIRRLAAVLTVAATVLSGNAAHAAKVAPKPATLCYLAVDHAGDAVYQYGAPFGPAPVLDITGLDIGTSRSDVTLRLRLMTTAIDPNDTYARSGLKWSAGFDVAGVHYGVQRVRTASSSKVGADDATYVDGFTVNGVETKAPGMRVTQDASSITWTVPRAAITKLAKPRQMLVSIHMMTTWLFGPSSSDSGPDGRSTPLDFADGQQSCPPLCPPVIDSIRDASYAPEADAQPLDVTGADVVTGAKTLAVVLMLQTTQVGPANPNQQETFTREQHRWLVSFTVGGTTYSVRRTRAGLEAAKPGTYVDELLANGTVTSAPGLTVTLSPTTMTWTMPRSAISTLKPHAVISGLKAQTSWTTNDRVVDTAEAGPSTTYTDRGPSCIRTA